MYLSLDMVYYRNVCPSIRLRLAMPLSVLSYKFTIWALLWMYYTQLCFYKYVFLCSSMTRPVPLHQWPLVNTANLPYWTIIIVNLHCYTHMKAVLVNHKFIFILLFHNRCIKTISAWNSHIRVNYHFVYMHS